MSVTAVPIRPIKKGSLAKLWVGLGALALVAGAVGWYGAEAQRATDPATFLAANAEREGVTTTPSGLQIEVIREGTGPSPTLNDVAVIEYEGRLLDGTVFDSSAQAGQPVPLPVAGVVPGFSEALQLMRQGGAYRIWLPPELGYGEQVQPGGPIPPNATLDFDVTLVQVLTPQQIEMLQRRQMEMMQGGGAQGAN